MPMSHQVLGVGSGISVCLGGAGGVQGHIWSLLGEARAWGGRYSSGQQGHSPIGLAGLPPSAGHASSAHSAAPAPGTAHDAPRAPGSGQKSHPLVTGHRARSSPAASVAAYSPGGATGLVPVPSERWHPNPPAQVYTKSPGPAAQWPCLQDLPH